MKDTRESLSAEYDYVNSTFSDRYPTPNDPSVKERFITNRLALQNSKEKNLKRSQLGGALFGLLLAVGIPLFVNLNNETPHIAISRIAIAIPCITVAGAFMGRIPSMLFPV